MNKSKIFIFTLLSGALIPLICSATSYRLTTSEINTINTNQTAVEGRNYYDTDLQIYKKGLPDGTISSEINRDEARNPSLENRKFDIKQIAPKLLFYWDTLLKKYFYGNEDGSFQPLFVQELFSPNSEVTATEVLDSTGLRAPDKNGQVQPGRAYKFDDNTGGNNDEVLFSNGDIDYSKGFTVSLWADYQSIGNCGLISSYSGTPHGALPNRWRIVPYSGLLYFGLVNNASFYHQTNIPNPLINDGKLHHIVFRYDLNHMDFFADGDQKAHYEYATSMGVGTDPIGLSLFTDQARCTGKVANVQVWNAPKSLEEINANDTSDLILWAKTDEGDGTIAYDSSGNGYHGTITNADLSTFHATDPEGSDWQNQVGYSAYANFTGGDHVEVPNNDNINFETGDFSIDILMYPKSDVFMGVYGKRIASNESIALYRHADGQLRFTSAGVGDYPLGCYANTNEFSRVSLVYSGTTMQCFINGTLANSTTVGTPTPNTASLFIGNDGTINDFDGYLANLRIWNTAKTISEITNKDSAGLVIDMPLNDESSVIKDATHSENTGILHATNNIWQLIPRDESTAGQDLLENDTAGTAYTESTDAYGTWEFDAVPDSNVAIMFIAENTNLFPNNPSYSINLHGADLGNTIQIQRLTGTANPLLKTAQNYIQDNVRYRVKITRTIDGEFTAWIKGGTFGDTYTLVDTTGGIGTNPVTDNTINSGNYFVAYLAVGDQFGNLKINGQKVPMSNFTEGTGTYSAVDPAVKDVLGNDLGYQNRVNYNAKLVGSNAGTTNGTNDYISIPKFKSFNGSEPFTIKINTTVYGNGTLISSIPSDADAGLHLQNSGGTLIAQIYNDNDNRILKTQSGFFTNGEPIEIIITYDGSQDASGFTIFKNGVPIDATTAKNTLVVGTDGDFYLGAVWDASSDFINAKIWNLAVWGSVKSVAEAERDDQNDLLAHYPLAEGAGTTIYDASGNGNHGTLNTSNATAFWSQTQDVYHYNLMEGFYDLSSGAKGPKKGFGTTSPSFTYLDISGYENNKVTDGVPNSGGAGATDWLDTGGLPDGYTVVISSSTESVVTGNGFSGNAFRVEKDNTTGDSVAAYNTQIGTFSGDYVFSFKYRLFMENPGVTNGYLRLYFIDSDGNIIPDSNTTIIQILENNTGDAITATSDPITAPTGATGVRFQGYFRTTGINYFEVDELNYERAFTAEENYNYFRDNPTNPASYTHPTTFKEDFTTAQKVIDNGGTASNVTFTNGAGSFNGTSSKIAYTFPTFNSSGAPISIRVKAKADIDSTGHRRLFQLDVNKFSSYIELSTNTLRVIYNNYDRGSSYTVPLGEYVEYVLIYNGTHVQAYANGTQVLNYATPERLLSGTFYVGASNTIQYFDGDIDLLEIYDRALTADEVSNLYNTGKTHPTVSYHNNAETKIIQYPAPELINKDTNNVYFNTSGVPQPVGYSDFIADMSGDGKISSKEDNGRKKNVRWWGR